MSKNLVREELFKRAGVLMEKRAAPITPIKGNVFARAAKMLTSKIPSSKNMAYVAKNNPTARHLLNAGAMSAGGAGLGAGIGAVTSEDAAAGARRGALKGAIGGAGAYGGAQAIKRLANMRAAQLAAKGPVRVADWLKRYQGAANKIDDYTDIVGYAG